MFFSATEDTEIVCGSGIDHHLFDVCFQDHPGNALECIFEGSFALFNSKTVLVQRGHGLWLWFSLCFFGHDASIGLKKGCRQDKRGHRNDRRKRSMATW
jgi:hypothetical protein